MPARIDGTDAQWYVTDAAAGAAPMPIGRFARTLGPHVVGFDDAFAEPLVMRAFYDLGAGPRGARRIFDLTFVGYVQLACLRFRGEWIRPSAYGGRLADRDVYLTSNGWFVDFMGPADAALRGLREPLYAYNGMLTAGVQRTADFYRHGLPNGSLFFVGARSPGQANYASIAAEVDTGLVTPANIEAYLDQDNVVRVIDGDPAAFAAAEDYRIALDTLSRTPGPGETAPPLEGLAETGVVARVVGPYSLLTLPDDENLGPTLCVWRASPSQVVVNLLTNYDMEQIEGDAGREALRRIVGSSRSTADAMDVDLPAETTGAPVLGRAGLLPEPIRVAPDEYVLSMDFVTVAVGYSAGGRRDVLDGFRWSVLFRFDEDDGTLRRTAVTAPAVAEVTDIEAPLLAFRQALDNPILRQATIDTSGFTKAAMRRDTFAGGRTMTLLPAPGSAS